MSVLLPAPFGPKRPIERPVSLVFNFFRMVRLPKRTSKPSSSMTGLIPLFKRRGAALCSHELRKRDRVLQITRDQVIQAHPHQVAAGRNADAVRFAISRNYRGFYLV